MCVITEKEALIVDQQINLLLAPSNFYKQQEPAEKRLSLLLQLLAFKTYEDSYAKLFRQVEDIAVEHSRMFGSLPEGTLAALDTLDRGEGFEPQELPALNDGETRQFFAKKQDVLQFFDDSEKLLETHELILRLAMDGRWAVDVIPVEIV